VSSSVTLVTGSSGFVGRAIMARLAAAGHRAVGLDPRPSASAAIAFLASPHSGYTSGSVVTIDAGLSAKAGTF